MEWLDATWGDVRPGTVVRAVDAGVGEVVRVEPDRGGPKLRVEFWPESGAARMLQVWPGNWVQVAVASH